MFINSVTAITDGSQEKEWNKIGEEKCWKDYNEW